MKYLILSLSFFCLSGRVCSQPLNGVDENGKKNGMYIRYMDIYWNVVDDSSIATCYRFTFYEHGINVHPMGAGGFKGWKLEPALSKNSMPVQLDGEYKWYDTKGRLRYVHTFNKGVYTSYKEFDTNGQLRTFFDYTRNYPGQPHSWYSTTYDKNGKEISEMFVKADESGQWPKMRG